MRFTPVLFLLLATVLAAQNPSSVGRAQTHGIPRFPIDNGTVSSAGSARAGAFLSDAGRRAALLGDETGSFEAWVWPLKLYRDLRLAFRIADNTIPLEGASLARQVVARAEGATVIYSHPSFTVREHLFVPLNEPGALILLEVQTIQPLEVLVRADADFNLAWPGRLSGSTQTWDAGQRRFLLADASTRYHGMLGSPAASAGSAGGNAAQLELKFAAGSTGAELIPIAIAGGRAAADSVAATYTRLLSNAAGYWHDKVERYRHVRDELIEIETPDTRLDQTLAWSKANLEQTLVCNADFGCGIVGGYGQAGANRYRPGRAWYFSSDAFAGAKALIASGQFEGARNSLLFLTRQQRSDGKVPSEISHAAATLPWFTQYPFAWSNAEATPQFIIAAAAYWHASNDLDFLRQFWPNVLKAFRWCAAMDTDGDGLMETPRAGATALDAASLVTDAWSDIYLAGTWVAALEATATLAAAARDEETARNAEALRARAARTLESAFWLPNAQYPGYALLRSTIEPAAARGVSDLLTAWPMVALASGLFDQTRADNTLRESASSVLTTDWGIHPLTASSSLFQPLQPGNGAVSLALSGVGALAHFRQHRTWSGQDLLRDMARASFDFARGRTPDFLSGVFYSPLEGSVPQSTMASAEFITAVVRGLFGLEADAVNRAVAFEPHLPAEWNSASVTNFRVGGERLDVSIDREGQRWTVNLRRSTEGAPIFVRFAPALPLGATITRVQIDDRDAPLQTEESPHDVHPVIEVPLSGSATIEIEYTGGLEVITASERLDIGSRSEALRVLDFRRADRGYVLLVEGLAGGIYNLALRPGARIRAVTGAELLEQTAERVQLRIRMPLGGPAVVRREIIVRM